MPSPIPASTTFEASAFAPEFENDPGGRAPGALRVEPGRLVFEPSGDERRPLELPFRGLEMRLGGASDRLIFFSHPDRPGVSLHTSDRRVLDHPHLATEAGIVAQVAKGRGRRRRGQLTTVAVLLGLVLALAGLVMLKDPLVGFVASQIPPGLEVQLGDVAFRQVTLQTELLRDPDLEQQLGALAAPLLNAIPDTGYPFDLHLADDPTLNAFALPGGHVVLHSGLVLSAESEDEVLGVLAHEIAHVTKRHSLHQLISTAGVFILFQTLLGDVSGIAAVIADGGFQLLTLQFSRDHELEADDAGFEYLLGAGIDPRGMLSFFETLQEEQEELLGQAAGLERSLSFLSTHPATAERIERLTEKLSIAGTTTPTSPRRDFDFAAFQDKIRESTAETASETTEE